MPSNPYKTIERGEAGQIGWRIHYFDEVASTQRLAAEMAAEGAAQGTVLIAELQTAGRGRMGRSWHSPAGVNLYSTTILRPSMPLAEVPRLSLMAGLAAAEAIESVAPGIVSLKWPNDVWLKRRKAGGIIAEAVTDSRQRLSCVLLGIGINVNLAPEDIPEDLRDKATSIRIATGRHCDRIELAAALFNRLNSRYMETEEGGFAAVRPAYERYMALRGRRVAVIDEGTRIEGAIEGIDEDGALRLASANGPVRVLTGDVTVEGAYDQLNQ
ncbi:MAG TPA: biotin--[acetyl-CoA-carboxylase] ligase [Candidatus Binataceae bacterium]|nr:biotin--[acetyl-CoA-carboxylase] ligase [Candidatus Binataceae bacterium]